MRIQYKKARKEAYLNMVQQKYLNSINEDETTETKDAITPMSQVQIALIQNQLD